MGIVHAHRGRLAPAILLTGLVVLAVAAIMALTAGPARAQATFTACASCHGMSATHSKTAHVSNGVYDAANPATCANCHPSGDPSQVPLPSKCGVCHGGVTVILAKQTHTGLSCGTTAGCHGYTSPTPTPSPTATVVATKVTLKVAPTTIKLRKTVKASGMATPATTLAAKKVALRADFKKGAKWVKVASKSVTVTSTGAYSWKYKPGKKGTYHITASIAKSATYKASKSKAMTFKVK